MITARSSGSDTKLKAVAIIKIDADLNAKSNTTGSLKDAPGIMAVPYVKMVNAMFCHKWMVNRLCSKCAAIYFEVL